MQKLKHIKYTKLSPILSETVPPQWSRHSVAHQKNPRGVGWRSFRCRFDLIRWSRHLVIY